MLHSPSSHAQHTPFGTHLLGPVLLVILSHVLAQAVVKDGLSHRHITLVDGEAQAHLRTPEGLCATHNFSFYTGSAKEAGHRLHGEATECYKKRLPAKAHTLQEAVARRMMVSRVRAVTGSALLSKVPGR